MEVNLAILIMAGGVLSVLGLYSLGYRENRQSRDDVISAAYADAVISPLVMALSATNVTWSSFSDLDSFPSENGWAEYIEESTGRVISTPQSLAQTAYSDCLGALRHEGSSDKVKTAWPRSSAGGLKAGLVISHEQNSPVVKISFRAARTPSELMAMPLYYTEVRFQGVVDE